MLNLCRSQGLKNSCYNHYYALNVALWAWQAQVKAMLVLAVIVMHFERPLESRLIKGALQRIPGSKLRISYLISTAFSC